MIFLSINVDDVLSSNRTSSKIKMNYKIDAIYIIRFHVLVYHLF